jgi:hypothetical protein
MRRLLFTLLCGLVVVPAAVASVRAAGDGVFELNDVNGRVAIGSVAQPAKGVLWGQMDKGTLKTVDPVIVDGQVLVSGYDTKTPIPATDTAPKMTVYTGENMHFRVTGGKYSLVFNGSGIDLTAVGVGVATLSGSTTADDPGTYAVDSGDWQPVPLSTDPTQPVKVSFPAQPVTSSP